jgi:hypothetical protein
VQGLALPTRSAWGCQAVPEPLVYVQYVKFAMEFKPPFLGRACSFDLWQ